MRKTAVADPILTCIPRFLSVGCAIRVVPGRGANYQPTRCSLSLAQKSWTHRRPRDEDPHPSPVSQSLNTRTLPAPNFTSNGQHNPYLSGPRANLVHLPLRCQHRRLSSHTSSPLHTPSFHKRPHFSRILQPRCRYSCSSWSLLSVLFGVSRLPPSFSTNPLGYCCYGYIRAVALDRALHDEDDQPAECYCCQ